MGILGRFGRDVGWDILGDAVEHHELMCHLKLQEQQQW
jgi:hypothetical protein